MHTSYVARPLVSSGTLNKHRTLVEEAVNRAARSCGVGLQCRSGSNVSILQFSAISRNFRFNICMCWKVDHDRLLSRPSLISFHNRFRRYKTVVVIKSLISHGRTNCKFHCSLVTKRAAIMCLLKLF